MTREKALEAALNNLLVWAEWHKARGAKHPTMGEPNTGAITAAKEAIAMPRDVPGMRLIPHTSEDCDCCEVAHEERARLLRVAEAVRLAVVDGYQGEDYARLIAEGTK